MGVLVGFVPGTKEMVLPPWAQGFLPRVLDLSAGECVAAGPMGC